jgi:hypothetical protein
VRKHVASGRRRYALLLLVGAATLVVMGNTCAPTKPPAPTGLSISPTSHDFGSVAVNGSSQKVPFTVTNNGPDVSGVLTVSKETGNTNQFAIEFNQCTGQQLDIGEECTVELAFNPTAIGPLTSDLVVKGDPGGTGVAILTGTGAP